MFTGLVLTYWEKATFDDSAIEQYRHPQGNPGMSQYQHLFPAFFIMIAENARRNNLLLKSQKGKLELDSKRQNSVIFLPKILPIG